MHENILIGISALFVIGISAQWLAWRFRLPAILLLLILGFVVGPLTGFIEPAELFGELLLPIVSLSVAVILYEGGLSLRFSDIREFRGAVLRLVSLGVLITWGAVSLCAFYILNLERNIALLLGAVLVVTGPTVIIR